LGGCVPLDKEKASFSIELVDYYWESEEVLQMGDPEFGKRGMQEIDILIVELQVTNESNQKDDIFSTSWYVIDDNRNEFDFTIFGDIPHEEDISFMMIQPGETVTGKVAFAMPSRHLPVWVHCSKCTSNVEIRQP
jgi:hypothetical protein